MNRVKKAGIGLGALVVTLLVVLLLLVATAPGLHLLLSAAVRWVPGLEIGRMEGGWRNLTLTDVRYRSPGIDVSAGALHVALQPNCLWRSQICLEDLALQALTVTVDSAGLPPSAPTAGDTSPETDITAPVTLVLPRIRLDNSRVQVDGVRMELPSLQTGIQWQGRSLTLLPTRIDGMNVVLPKTPASPVAAPPVADAMPLGERLRTLFASPLLPEMPSVSLPLDVTVADLQGESWSIIGEQTVKVTRLHVKADARQQGVTLQQLAVQLPQGALYAHGEATLAGDWPLTLNANAILNVEPLKGERLRLTAAGALRRQLALALNLSGPQRAQLDVKTELAQAGLPLTVSVQSQQLRWPLSGEAQYQVDGLRLHLGGKATDYQLALRGALRGAALPPGQLTLEGTGSERQFSLSRLRLSALQGTADLSGRVEWPQAVRWQGELALQGIDTARQWPDWPLRLDGGLSMAGSLESGRWQIEVPRLALDGSWRQNRLSAKGSLSGSADGRWKVPSLTLALGRNQLAIQGELAEQWNLTGELNAPVLNQAWPGLAGQATGRLRLDGNRDAPHLLADLTASAVRWQALSLSQLTLKGDVRAGRQVQGTLALQGRQFTQGDMRLSAFSLQLQGDEANHQLRLNVSGEPVAGQLALHGRFDQAQQRWQGDLSDSRFETPVGEWRLAQRVALNYQVSAQKLTVGTHCWRNPNAELCVPQPIEAGPAGKASVALNRLNLAMLAPFLPPESALSGTLAGNADVSWQSKGGLPEAKVMISGQNVTLRQHMQGNTLPVVFDALTFNAALQRGQAVLGWHVAIRGNGRFNGDVQISDPQHRRDLSGTLVVSNLSLDMLRPLLRQGEKAAGRLDANLRLAGNLQRPSLFGQVSLDGLAIDGIGLPVAVTDGRLALGFTGMSSTLQGYLKTMQGQVNLAGNADWAQPEAWRARIAANGERIRVTIPPMARLDVSPDIVFDASPQLLSLTGTVTIPWARIVVQEMPASAVDVSADEVMLDAQRQPLNKSSSAIPINSRLVVRIGNDVWLDAYGLKARLSGDLNVAQDQQGLGLHGQIVLPEGRFKAYGQDLQVRKGQLLFSGPPTLPVLNIEAIRNPDNTEDDVVAGVRITGTASSPKLDVFSEPTLSQQEALSYLLRGQGLGSSGADSAMMTSALIGLGVAQSGQVVGKIGEAFGVSNLALDTQGVGDKSQVVVSGYVLPGLQVKYGVGLFDSLATLTLRYRLMPKLYLEAVSGVSQALDVLYQFEF
ncbi:translocation/assembly module TamB domain-containing protein [Musicola keenii]|uniref:autotransporter assembly complex protein TamB n=1 Tax=Musicola keenii TaxID=2884250 RepID=UPI001785886A|nr:translocation/assembly module TamB domain-containing protein [Musicola keenii]